MASLLDLCDRLFSIGWKNAKSIKYGFMVIMGGSLKLVFLDFLMAFVWCPLQYKRHSYILCHIPHKIFISVTEFAFSYTALHIVVHRCTLNFICKIYTFSLNCMSNIKLFKSMNRFIFGKFLLLIHVLF